MMGANKKVDSGEVSIGTDSQVKINLAADVIFTLFIATVVGIFFIDAIDYHRVASRAPFVIMVPLVILIIVHLVKLGRVIKFIDISEYLKLVIKRKDQNSNKFIQINAYITSFIICIYIFGYYVSSALFLLILIKIISKEKLKVTISLMGAVPLFLYLVFEVLLGLQLYRGILYLLWRGYEVF
jgi:hypothetical protein